MPTPPFSLGVDTGGTFTDLVQLDGAGRLTIEKSFSTPDRPEHAVLDVVARMAETQGLDVAGLLADTVRFAHGTTVSTNALIQRKGARVGLLTTRGFEDTLVIGRGPLGRAGGLPQSQAMDFLHTEPPEPLVPKRLIRGLGERVAVTGEVLAPLDAGMVRAALGELLDEGIESLAVCLLWSFRNPAHEKLVGCIAAEMAPDLPVSLSCDIAPRLGEFERMVTTVVNAFIGPVTERYLGALQGRLADAGLESPVQIMTCSSGVTLPERIASQAVSVVNSGPVGGLVAARHLGARLGHDKVITADMGGTSFDVGLIADGGFEEESVPFLGQGLPVQVPTIRIVTIGAGGGSIARSDGHRLHVGPESAGADPGPACYGRGGERPTVTDALVTLGIIDPENFFGGRYALDPELARAAIARHVATPLGLGVMDAASAIYEVVTAHMADLIRKVSVESGNDPREFCLFAYGGAGGAHCAVFAAQLGIGKIIIPYAAPVFSAFGIALSDIVYSHTRSDPVRLDAAPDTLATVNRAFTELEDRAMADMRASAIDTGDVALRHRIDMRYLGQMNEVAVEWDGGRLAADDLAALQSRFEALYQRRFGAGTIRPATPLELITYRVDAVKRTEKPDLAPLDAAANGAPRPEGRRRIHQRGSGPVDAAIIDFTALRPGDRLDGPAVIERDNTTVWLPPGSAAALDPFGNLEITPAGREGAER